MLAWKGRAQLGAWPRRLVAGRKRGRAGVTPVAASSQQCGCYYSSHRKLQQKQQQQEARPPPPQPPRARKGPGPDPYAWMEEASDEVLEHLMAENRYSHRAMLPTRRLQSRVFDEMMARLGVDDEEKEENDDEATLLKLAEAGGDGYLYYSRRPRGKNFPIYCRRRGAPSASPSEEEKEEVLLDQNAMPDFYQRMTLGDLKVSPRQTRLAFTLAAPEEGGRGVTLFVKELSHGGGGPWWTAEGGAWAGVGTMEWGATTVGQGEGEEEEVLYYTRVDAHGRPHEAWAAHLPLGSRGPSKRPSPGLTRRPERVHALGEECRAFFLSVNRTKDRRFVTLSATSKASSEVWLLPGPTASPLARGQKEEAAVRPRLFRPRRPGVQYFVDHGGGAFFVVTNAGSPQEGEQQQDGEAAAPGGGEYRLMTCPTEDTGSWQPCLPSDGSSSGSGSIEDVDLFADFCVLYQRHEGLPGLLVLDRRHPASHHRPTLPPEVATGRLQPGLNQDYRAASLRFSVTSPILPDVSYAYDLRARTLTELHRERLPGRPPLDPAKRYACRRVLVEKGGGGEGEEAGADAPPVPMTLACRKDLDPSSGSSPVLLQGYGAYGVCLDLGFRPEAVPLLERGWVLAFAHVRGGGEGGRAWHAAGKGPHKLNSLLDYLRCAQHLVAEGWTRPGLIVGHGSSAGALVVAGAAHRRPGLFGAMILKYPFLDLARNMIDPSLPLTVHEYDEWGDPRSDPGVLARLRALSPYETLPAAAAAADRQGSSSSCFFPPTLVLASLADDRVRYWEPAKYVAKAREESLGKGGEVLLRMEDDRGHEGPAAQTAILQEAAFEQAFMLTRLGLAEEADAASEEEEGPWSRRSRQRRGRRGGRIERYLPEVPPLAFWS